MRIPIRLLAPLLVVAAASAVLLVGSPEQPVQALQAPTAGKLTPDLALVPGEALAFVHIRVAEVWKSDTMKEARKFIEKAGPKALGILDKDFVPAPSTIDRITLVALPFKDKPEPNFATIFAFSAPFDAEKIRKQYLPKAEPMKAGGKSYHVDNSAGLAIYFADDKNLVLSDPDNMKVYLGMVGKSDGPLKSALETAAGKAMTACVNIKALPNLKQIEADLPEEFRPLLKTERILVTADVKQEVTVSLELGFASDDDAKAGDKGLRKAAEFARVKISEQREQFQKLLEGKNRGKDQPRPFEELSQAIVGILGLAGLNTLDEFLADPPTKTAGKSISTSFTLPTWATEYVGASILSAGLMLPAVQKVREAAARQAASNNLKQIALAMHAYHDVHGSFPPAAVLDKKGKKLLSWRVLILPYIEQDNVFKLFKMDEPWDSEDNKKASSVIIKTYCDPRASEPASNKTYYKLFVGKATPFEWAKSRKIEAIPDGSSNTIMVAAAGPAVEWAKPDDFEFDPEKKLPDLTKPFKTLLVSMCDGSVRSINPEMKDFEKIMKLLIQADDGTPIPDFE